MLQRANGIAKPAIVADGQQHVTVAGIGGDEVRVGHFVANKRHDPDAIGLKRRLIGRAATETGHGQVKKADQTAKPLLQRHILTERHQLLLMVDAAAATDGHDAVVVRKVFNAVTEAVPGDAGNQCAALSQFLTDVVDDFASLVLGNRNSGFRPQNQVGIPVVFSQLQVSDDLVPEEVRVPLDLLGNVALHRDKRRWFCLQGRPLCLRKSRAGYPGQQRHAGDERRAGMAGFPDQPPTAWNCAAGHGHPERKPVDAR